MLTVQLFANETTGAGVDFEADFAAFFADFEPYSMPLFLAEGADETTQIVHLEAPTAGKESTARAVLVEGQDFYYTFSNHSVSGTIETIRLTRLGDAYDADTGELNYNDDGLVDTASEIITISGLSIYNEAGVMGDVHEVIKGFMGGGLEGTAIDAAAFSEFVWAEGHEVIGSTGNDTYAGTKYADIVRGGKGADDLKGGNGADILSGGNGSDTLSGGKGADRLSGGNGTDTLSGGNGTDTLLGGNGADTLSGGKGADTLSGGKGTDALSGGNGTDTLSGGNGADTLSGGNGADTLSGGNGADTLSGGKGTDTLSGGNGADTFEFNTKAEANGDVITDFTSTDMIDLSDIDADSTTGGNQAFTFIAESSFSGVAGELRIIEKSSKTVVAGDIDGDGSADFRITLLDASGLDSGDFLL
ncbi:calcium-binding protein [Aquicoccus sp. SU-CL01552]|uniref:calcium-binding protein n=1 Tax=Aquicoccus sp. SU-CL01552 TaxID=3127656 RepID=UPI003107AECF